MKHVSRNVIALILSVIVFLIGYDTICSAVQKIAYQKELHERNAPYNEIIKKFNRNNEKFEAVKDYMLTEEDGFELTAENYSNEINDEEIKKAAKLIFSKLKYETVKKTSDIVTFKVKDNNLQKLVFFEDASKYEAPEYELYENVLYGNWRIFNLSHGIDGPLVILGRMWYVYLLLVFALLLFIFYRILGLLPRFGKKQNSN